MIKKGREIILFCVNYETRVVMVVISIVGGKDALVRMIFHAVQTVKICLKDCLVGEFSLEQAGQLISLQI